MVWSFCVGKATYLMAQDQAAPEEVRWLRGRITDVNAGLEIQGDRQQQTVANSGEKVKLESFYVVPTVGLGLQGSVYHPNLFDYHLNLQGGEGWQETSVNLPGGGTRSDPYSLLRYQMNASILKEKPYAASFFAEREQTTTDYDFFTRAIVDQQSLGGRAGYAEGPVPFSVSFRQSSQDISGIVHPLTLDQSTLVFAAYNERSPGHRTDLSYTLDDYSRQETDAYTQQGRNHLVSLTDVETFGPKDRLRLNSILNYNQLDTTTAPWTSADTTERFDRFFTDHEYLNWKHTEHLQSDYNYSYNLQDSGPLRTDGQAASAAVRHQLYESLSSAFDVHTQLMSSRGDGSTLDVTRYGLGLNETYTKRLDRWGRLTLGYGGLLDHEQRDTSGPSQFILGETHVLSDDVLTFLAQPRVNRLSIQVWDASGNVLYRELLDYLIIPHGERTQIQRVVGGQIPNGASVRVDYSVAPQPSDSYSTFANQFQIRLDLFQGLLGLYGHLNLQDNYGGQSLVLENITDQVVGMDVTWRFLRAGAEYEVYDSNLAPYRAARLFENLTFEANASTTLSLDAAQSWSTFPNSNTGLTSQQVIARVQLRLAPSLSVNTEGGVRFEHGYGYDQQLATARFNLQFKSGKLALQTGYEYEDQAFTGAQNLRHFFFLRAKRSF